MRTTLGSSCQCFHEDVLSEVPPQVTSSAVTSCCQVTSCACSLSLEALLPSSHLAERYPPLMVLLQAHKLHVSKLSHISSPGCSCLRILAVGCVQGFPSTVGCGGFRYQLQGEGHPGRSLGCRFGRASTDTALSARRMLVIALRSTLNNGNNKNKAAWRKGESKLNSNEVAWTHQHDHYMEIIFKRKKKSIKFRSKDLGHSSQGTIPQEHPGRGHPH